MNPRTLTLVTAAIAVLAVTAIALAPRLRAANSGAELDLSGQPFLGAADAPVEIVLFEDFRCPHCATFTETVFPRLEREFVDSGEARIYYLNFPVLGETSVAVAELGECVHEQDEDAFWQLKPVLFRSQAGGDLEHSSGRLDLVRGYAPDIDVAALESCLDSEAPGQAVARDQQMARDLQLTGTPSVLVDGRLTNGSYDDIAGAVRRALDTGN